MSDFETHARGTTKELQLSRQLANVIAEELDNPNNDIPLRIVLAYTALYEHHLKMMEQGVH